MTAGKWRTLLVTALVSSAVTILFIRWNDRRFENVPASVLTEAAEAAGTLETPPGAAISPDEEVNIRVYNKVSPGVVNITSMVVEFDFFFRPFATEAGTGSGLVLDKEGHILTNSHVIEGARNLEVALPDQTKYRATVIGRDSQNDLAVIRLVGAPPERLVPVPIGDSSNLKVGQKVLAIGNPFRLQNTLTVGIISSIGRTIQTEGGYLVENVIQTDAAINPGNSGGPLLNSAGEMVGVNTSIFTTSGGNIGIGFAVPANTVKRIVADLIKEGRVLRPWLGIEGYAITDDLASALDLPVREGILVARVYRGSSAESAGIRGATEIAIYHNERVLAGGDIVTELNGRSVRSMEDIRLALEDRRPGTVVPITIYSGRTRRQLEMALQERPRGLRF